MKAHCILCLRLTRRKLNPLRPCCSKCEKTAPVAVTAPALFADRGPAAQVARSAMAAVEAQR